MSGFADCGGNEPDPSRERELRPLALQGPGRGSGFATRAGAVRPPRAPFRSRSCERPPRPAHSPPLSVTLSSDHMRGPLFKPRTRCVGRSLSARSIAK